MADPNTPDGEDRSLFDRLRAAERSRDGWLGETVDNAEHRQSPTESEVVAALFGTDNQTPNNQEDQP